MYVCTTVNNHNDTTNHNTTSTNSFRSYDIVLYHVHLVEPLAPVEEACGRLEGTTGGPKEWGS